ncbi:MAG: hypothetical protein AB8B65_16685 [Kordia sp.]|uniref:hypothetical protein n=1 Tax=Kordia sp. TaxID=1965332 RepID=UPI003858615E
MNFRLFIYAFVIAAFFACDQKEKKTNTATETTQKETVGLTNGRWINTRDENSGIEINDGKFYMFNKVGDKTVTTTYTYKLDEKDGIEYLNLKNDADDILVYGLLEYSDESLVLSYLNRGSTLTYRKEK